MGKGVFSSFLDDDNDDDDDREGGERVRRNDKEGREREKVGPTVSSSTFLSYQS